jgi:hypothetical protein
VTTGTDGPGDPWAVTDQSLDGAVVADGEDLDGAQDEAAHPGDESAATGHARVDDAVARLAELDRLPTAEHADVYEDVHRRLHTALTELDAD